MVNIPDTKTHKITLEMPQKHYTALILDLEAVYEKLYAEIKTGKYSENISFCYDAIEHVTGLLGIN